VLDYFSRFIQKGLEYLAEMEYRPLFSKVLYAKQNNFGKKKKGSRILNIFDSGYGIIAVNSFF
jgi:hypothetical protein